MSHHTTADLSVDSAGRGTDRMDRLAAARLYLCTDARRDKDDLEAFLHAAYSGGVDIIQLRDKTIDTADELAALQILAQVAAEHGALFAVNDRADVAALVGADVFHIGQRDLSPEQARQLLGDDVVIGRSTHAPEQAAAALADPAVDYFCTGPVWATPTKPGRPAAGLGYVRTVAEMVAAGPTSTVPASTGKSSPKPWFAIGGIDAHRLPEVSAAGADRIVIVRAVTEAPDPAAAAAELRALLPA